MKKEALQSQPLLAYTTILPTLLFSISQIILHAIVPQVIVELVCLHESGSVDCDGSDVSGKASLINLISATIISVPNVLVIGFYASFSKRFGLKPTLLTPVLGNFLFLSSVFAAKQWSGWYKPLIMLGSLISGLSGSRNTFMLATFAYAADVSAPQERSNVFSVIESAIYLARVFCPLTIGVLSHRHGFGFTLGIGMVVCLCNLMWIWFVMRDPGSALAEGGCVWLMSLFGGDSGSGNSNSNSGSGGNSNSINSSNSNSTSNSNSNSSTNGGGTPHSLYTSITTLLGCCCGRSKTAVQAGSGVGVARPSDATLPQRVLFADRDGGRGSRDALEDNLSMLPTTASIVIYEHTHPHLAPHGPHGPHLGPHMGLGSMLGSLDSLDDLEHDLDLDLGHDRPDHPDHSDHSAPTRPLIHMLDDDDDEPTINRHLSVGAARPTEKLAWHPLETFRSVARVFGKNSIGNPTVPYIAATYFVYHMVVVGVHTVEILFVKYVFKWVSGRGWVMGDDDACALSGWRLETQVGLPTY